MISLITTGLALDPTELRWASFPACPPTEATDEGALISLPSVRLSLYPVTPRCWHPSTPPQPRYRWNRRKSDPRFLYHKTFIIILKKCYCKFESMIFLMWSSSHPAWSYRPGWSIVGTCLLNSRLKCPLMQRNLFHLSGSLSVSGHRQLNNSVIPLHSNEQLLFI